MPKKHGYHCTKCGRRFWVTSLNKAICPDCGNKKISPGFPRGEKKSSGKPERGTARIGKPYGVEEALENAEINLYRWLKWRKTVDVPPNEQTTREGLVSPLLINFLGYEPLSELSYEVKCGQNRIDYLLKPAPNISFPLELKKEDGDLENALEEIKKHWRNEKEFPLGWATDGLVWYLYLKGVPHREVRGRPCEIVFPIIKDGEVDEREIKHLFYLLSQEEIKKNKKRMHYILEGIKRYYEDEGAKQPFAASHFGGEQSVAQAFWTKIRKPEPAEQPELAVFAGKTVTIRGVKVEIKRGLTITGHRFLEKTGVYVELILRDNLEYELKRFAVTPGTEPPALSVGASYKDLKSVYWEVKPGRIADTWARGFFEARNISMREIFTNLDKVINR